MYKAFENAGKHIARIWNVLIGDEVTFPLERRSFHSVSVLSSFILCILFPFNIWTGLYTMALLIASILVLQVGFFYLSRFHKKYYASVALYSVFSYITLIVTFYYNSGSNGPALTLFFLTFMLLVSATPVRKHYLFVISHLAIGAILLSVENIHPDWIKNPYATSTDRFIDLLSTYFVTIGFVYFILRYLLKNYSREKKLATIRSYEIEKQYGQLQDLNDEKTKLFSIISHDLRSPINSIQSYLELLATQHLDNEDRAQLEGTLLDLTKNTSDMLYNLLTWSNTQMKGVTAHLQTINVLETLQNILDIEQIIASKKLIDLQYDIPADITITADPDMLQLVIRNLINNAVKFTHDHGTININARVEADICTISVADSGIGIEADKQQELFKLRSITSYGTNNEKGIGLGLVLCKEYVELQGGRLWFHSEIDKGTTFNISLPVQS